MYYVVPSLCYKEGGTSCKFIHPLQYFAFFRVMNSSLVILYSSFELSFFWVKMIILLIYLSEKTTFPCTSTKNLKKKKINKSNFLYVYTWKETVNQLNYLMWFSLILCISNVLYELVWDPSNTSYLSNKLKILH